MWFAIQTMCENHPKMLPKPPQEHSQIEPKMATMAPSWPLGAIIAHLGRNLLAGKTYKY
jgi:hypothetical protein